jgi:hypothetical protein
MPDAEPPNLFLRSALARLRSWTEKRAAAELRGDAAAVADAERFISEYNALIETAMKACHGGPAPEGGEPEAT